MKVGPVKCPCYKRYLAISELVITGFPCICVDYTAYAPMVLCGIKKKKSAIPAEQMHSFSEQSVVRSGLPSPGL